MRVFVSLLAMAVSGCTTPADVSRPAAASDDRNVRAEVEPTPDGFTIDLRYSRYQFVPETSAIAIACRSALRMKAEEEARLRQRAINEIRDEDIRISFGRNIINARTACRAFAEVKWST